MHLVVPQGASFLTQSTAGAPVPGTTVTKEAAVNAKLVADLGPAVSCINYTQSAQHGHASKSTSQEHFGAVAVCSSQSTVAEILLARHRGAGQTVQ